MVNEKDFLPLDEEEARYMATDGTPEEIIVPKDDSIYERFHQAALNTYKEKMF